MPSDDTEEFSAWGAYQALRSPDPRFDQPLDPLQPDGPTARSMARDHLAKYTEDRRALGLPLFPQQAARATSERNDYHTKLFTRPLGEVLPADDHARLESQAQRSLDPDRYRARQVVKRYLTDVIGTELPPEQYDHARTQFARQHLGLTSDTSDKAVFAAMKTRFTEDDAAATLVTGQARELFQATLTGREGKEVPSIIPGRTIAYEGRTIPDPAIGWKKLEPQIPERLRAGARHAYYEAYLEARRQSRKLAPAVDEIEIKLRALRDTARETGTENFLGDLWDEAAALLPDHPDQRATAIGMLRGRMQGWSADERGAFERTLASAGRGLRLRGRGFYDAARATGERGAHGIAPGSDQARMRERMGTHHEKVRALQALQYGEGDSLLHADDSFLTRGIIFDAESASGVAASFAGPAGLLAMALSTSGERYTEARLPHPGADRGLQLNAALLSGTIEARIEQGFNVAGLKFLKGKLPGLAGIMNKAGISSPFARSVIAGATGYAATIASQYAEEGLQEGTNRFLQDIANELSGIKSDTNWHELLTEWVTVSGQEQQDVLTAVTPFALVAGAGASFKHFHYGEYLRRNSQLLHALGVPDARIREIVTTSDVAKADAAFRQAFDDGLEERTGQQRADAFAVLDEQARLLDRAGLPVVTTEANAFTGKPEHVFTTPDGHREVHPTRAEALESWSTWTLAQNEDHLDLLARATTEDIGTFLTSDGKASRGTRGESVDVALTPDEAVHRGYATPEQMRARLEIFALQEGRQANAAELRVFARRFSQIASDGTYRAVVQYFRGADPLNIIEDFAEDAWDRGLHGGAFTSDELIGYLRQTEDATGQRYLADGYAYSAGNRMPLLEALSKASTEYVLGNAKAEALPARFRQWLEMITAVTANAFRHAQTLARSQNLTAAIKAGKIDPTFERLIADSVGLNAEAIERRVQNADASGRTSASENLAFAGVNDASFSLGKDPEPDNTTRHEDQADRRERHAGREPEVSGIRARRSTEEIRSQISRAIRAGSFRSLKEGAESTVFTVGDEAVLKLPHKQGAIIHDRQGGYIRSTDREALHLKAAILNALGGFDTTALENSGEIVLFQERGEEITDEEYANAFVPLLNATPRPFREFLLKLDGRTFMVSDLHKGNFAKDKDGNVRLIDLVVGEVDPDLTLPDYDGNAHSSPASESTPEQVTPPDQTIGERHSKLRKRPPKDGEDLEKTIAETIQKRVDKKAAKPQLHLKGPWKGVGVLRRHFLFAKDLTLTPEEEQILQSPHEILLIHTADGRLQRVRLGTKEDSNLPGDLKPGDVVSHNHPGGRGPSDGDLKAALKNPGVTFRIITRNKSGKIEIFSLRATAKLDNDGIDFIAEAYAEHCKAMGDTASARRKALALLSESTEGILVINRSVLP